MEEQIPPDKVKTSTGKIIDKADACWPLLQSKVDEDKFISRTGTLYHKDVNGTLHRLTPKKTKKGKKNGSHRNKPTNNTNQGK